MDVFVDKNGAFLSSSKAEDEGSTLADCETIDFSANVNTSCVDTIDPTRAKTLAKTPTAVRLHRLRLKCSGRMPTKRLSAALDWIESENFLSLSPPAINDSSVAYFDGPISTSLQSPAGTETQSHRQILLSHGFLARGRRTSPSLSSSSSDNDDDGGARIDEGIIMEPETGALEPHGEAALRPGVNTCGVESESEDTINIKQDTKDFKCKKNTTCASVLASCVQSPCSSTVGDKGGLNVRYTLFQM